MQMLRRCLTLLALLPPKRSTLAHIPGKAAVLLIGVMLLVATGPAASAQSTVYAMTSTGAFGTLNLSSGTFTQLGSSGQPPAGMASFGNSLFIAGYQNHTLYLVNPGNGTLAPVGNGTISYYELGAVASNLYAIGTDNNLYSINAGNGASTLIGPIGLDVSHSTSGMSSNGPGLYLTVDSGSGSVLYSVNTTTGAATTIGPTGLNLVDSMVYVNGSLYAAPHNALYILNTSTGASTFVANTGIIAWGMALPPFSSGQTSQPPLRLVNVMPCRLVDTRNSHPIQGQTFQSFSLPSSAQSGGAYGTCPHFDLSSAQAYSLNVTLVPNGHRVGYLTIWPTGEAQPFVSLMNSDGRVKANAAIVPAGVGGQVSVYVTNTTDVLIDIDAYFDAASDPNALAFYPLEPCRLVDTRQQNNGAGFHGTMTFNLPLSASGGGVNGTCSPVNLSTAQAYSLNVTGLPVNGGQLQYLTIWPDGQSQPVVSTLNDYAPYATVVANAAIVPAGAQQLTNVFATDPTNVLIDINGFFAPASFAPSEALSLYNVTPCRVLDTRNGIGLFSGTIPVGIVGSSCGIPSASQEAFVLNATVVPDGPLGYLTLWPEGQSQMPVVSTLNAYDGAITSNMAIVPAGTFNNSIDAFVPTNHQTQLILDISSYFAPVATLAIETTSLPDGTQGVGYSVPLVAVGGVAPYTWVQAGGHLPPGVSISSSGTISGTPTSTGTFSFGVQVTDSESPAQVKTAGLQITVNASGQTLGITTMSLPSATVNTPYNALLAANGGVTPYSWSILSGALPVGLNLTAGTGQISGTPQAAGLSVLTVQVTDALNHTAMQALNVAVNTGDASGTLNGMYAFSFTGYNADTLTPFVVAGSMTMDGEGNVVTGEYDFNDPNNGVEHDTITGGGFTLGSDGLGQLHFTDNTGANVQMLIAVGSGEDSRVISMNVSGQSGFWGAGVFRQQNPADFNFALFANTNFVFALQGFDVAVHPIAVDGSFSEDSNGNIAGVEDINDFGTNIHTTITAHPTSSVSSNGRYTEQQQIVGVGTRNRAIYIISDHETVSIGIDSGGPFTISNGLRQATGLSNSSLNGKAVGRGSRQAHANSPSPVNDATVLLISADGQGNLTFTEDDNNGGVITQGAQLTGTYSVDSSTGRSVFNLSDGSMVICYVIVTNEAQCINTVGGAGVIYFEPQAAGPFNNAYLNGEFLGGSLPQYASTTDSTIETFFVDGVQNGLTTFVTSGPDGITPPTTGLGTYTIDGTGAITILGGGSPVAIGYVVNPRKIEFISLDGDPRTFIDVISSAP